MKNRTNAIRLGGGKTLTKSITYATILFSILTISTILSDTVNAAKKKTTSTKRAATSNKKSTKRAATSNTSTKRAATSSASKQRVVSRTNSRKKAVIATNENTNETTNNTTTKEETTETKQTQENIKACPVEKVITGKYNEEGELIYYNGKDTCAIPENSSTHKWDSSLKTKYPRGSVKEDEAYYFKCDENYILKTVNNERICSSVLNTCPLNIVLEKSNDKFISPETGEVCELPANSKTRLTKAGENYRSDIEDSSAYIAECNANRYSDVIDGSNSELHFQCKACPTGFESPVGSTLQSNCIDPNIEKEIEEKKLKLEEEMKFIQETLDKQTSLRIKKKEGTTDDYTCIDGWTNNWEMVSNKLAPPKIMDSNGVIKNTIDRNNYGKNKVGCPIKSTEILLLSGVKTYNSNTDYINSQTIKVGNAPSAFMFATTKNRTYPKVGLLRYKMVAKDLTNNPSTGWTDEEYSKWGNYKPVIGLYYETSYKYIFYDGKISLTTNVITSQNKKDNFFKNFD